MGVSFISGGGSGDMLKSTYDSNGDGVIDGDAGGTEGVYNVTTKTDNYSVQTSDFAMNAAFAMNSSSDKAFTLPSVDASNVGFIMTFINLGSGKLTINAADSDTIHDGTGGGTIYNDNDTNPTVTLLLTSETTWSIAGYSGAFWITT